MSSTYGLQNNCTVDLPQAKRAERPQNSFARDVGDVLLELRQVGPIALVKTWRARQLYRLELRRMRRVGQHMISDIGLTLAEAQDETDRPFWRL